MSRRVVIITELIAPYRIPAFNALAQRNGIDLHVIFLSENDYSQRQWRVYKDEIQFSYEVLSSWRRRLGRQSFLLNWGAESALRRASPDFIVCGGYNYVASWQSMSWARRNNVPFSLWCESTSRDFRRAYSLVEFCKRQFLRHCDAFVVPGKSSFEYLRDCGVPKELIFTAPNAVDTEFFANRAEVTRRDAARHRRALRLPQRFFLYAGRLVREKGIFDLLHAYDALQPQLRENVGLVFVGDGPERSALLKHAAARNPGSIHFVGFVQREELAAYYALAEIFVFPTQTDPWGLVVNEAMACGLPVIASHAAGCVADLVDNGWNGRVVPAGNIQRLTCAMQELAHDAELRALMGKRSRERVEQSSPEAWAAGMANAVTAQREEAA
jgi:glycosyltransferase involved in cell wall biosynthesis